MKNHKPVVVVRGDSRFCRLCGVPVVTSFRKNGRHVDEHDTTSSERFPILGDDLKPVEAKRCTCGAQQFTGCFCGLTIHEFIAAHPERSVN